ncbi:FdtA/QdtA family cupin domain-containing protein [Rhodoplanes sp. TEM]|uniref:FdtA/QdtA family cupin domain-containing protein n=1 Tax=Rhodoplanes tepidamans TaxID=200616 RepID=A0ABT5JMB1_RHOTP|nr:MULTISPECIES: FdtA/QdtA family cupin domain-containing protein [Rhodoplanes]MDC7789920.1 FdtA/QdtA family cupin domain-containing protein [Rhodoplanes tepidamans]MDC7988089.1 FdtA/QdtA family cupin domain-containing protein [Rhodoplanes sp. TEM]MDQ0358929.1 dTDP-4-dehydrorhamnose 3,5-epimerase-like enzyme [Rhodoplanes tepidamans]
MTGFESLTAFGGVVRPIRIASRRDARGALHPFDYADLPFVPRRVFVVEPSAAGTVRGGHANTKARQLLVRLAGTIDVALCHAGREARVRLDATETALLLEPLVWAEQTYVTPDALLMVLASEPFDPGSYIGERPAAGGRGDG